MRVLIACERSQTVCKAFREKGVEAYSCDLEPSYGDLDEYHIMADARDVILYESWDLIIAHPPCTYLANSGGFRLIGDLERQEKMHQARDFFMFFYNLKGRVCIENPKPSPYADLPTQSDIIQPFQFGDEYTKMTYLWLKNLPPLFSTNVCLPNKSWVKEHRGTRLRSKTFPGIAKAMAYYWSDLE